MRGRRRPGAAAAVPAALLATLALVLGGCATEPGGPTDPDTPVSSGPDDPVTDEPDGPTDEPTVEPSDPGDAGAGDVPAELTVVLDETGEGQTRTFTLTCAPPGGDHPDADAACAALAGEGAAALDPVPPDVACTEIYGGPQRATVTGELDGAQVRATLSRSNGCEIARWDALAPLLVSTGGLL